MRVIVVGAGLVGLTSAYALSSAGAEVVLVERAVVGSGASRGNAGQVCPDQATPVAKASLIFSALSQAYRKDSSLHVRFATVPDFLPFLLRIARNASSRSYAVNQAGLVAVETLATQAFLDLADEIGVKVSNLGYLHVYRTLQAAVDGRKNALNRVARSDFDHHIGEVIDSVNLGEIEPALKPAGYGFLDEGSLFVNPNSYVDSLHRRLVSAGVEIHEGTAATSVANVNGREILRTSRGDFSGDAVVIAAGVGSAGVGAASGYRMPMKPGKGYSFSIDLESAPSHVLKFESAHVAALPLHGKTLRVAGTMEFDADPNRFNPDRISQIVAGVKPYLPSDALESRYDEWVGARPLTPDGLPVIDKVPGLPSTYVASGHNMLGLMYAPLTAEMVKDMVIDGRPQKYSQFSASRKF